MKREQQLSNAAFDYVNQGGTTAEWCDGWEDYSDAEYIEQAFKAGAEWEYKRFLHKACEWLKDEISNYVSFDGEIDEDLITDFIKEMEE